MKSPQKIKASDTTSNNGTKPKPKAWTVMVYLAGDNNLSAECVYALTEMKKANLTDRINVIAQFDPQDPQLPTLRYKITNDAAPGKLLLNHLAHSPFLQESEHASARIEKRLKALAEGRKAIKAAGGSEFGDSLEFEFLGEVKADAQTETDTGVPVTLYNFMSYCVEQFEAQHYLLVLSGHGGGTEPDFLMKDESPHGSLTIPELKQAFADLQQERGGDQKIDILGLDSCLMSMAEVCYELRGLVDIVVGSEGYTPAAGWPYREILERLAREVDDAMPALGEMYDIAAVQRRVAKSIVDEYVNFYTDYWLGGVSVVLAALDVSKVEELKTRIDNLASALVDELDKRDVQNALILAHWDAQSYHGELFVDLADFCNCLIERFGNKTIGDNKTISDLCEPITTFITGDFVLKSCYSGPVYQFSYGVSVYFPWSRVTPSYDELEFGQQSSWRKFLEAYTEKTRRPPRGSKEAPEPDQFNSPLESQRVRVTYDRGMGLPMYSMRNPPLIAPPEDCIRARASILEGLPSLSEPEKRPPSIKQQASNHKPAKQQASKRAKS